MSKIDRVRASKLKTQLQRELLLEVKSTLGRQWRKVGKTGKERVRVALDDLAYVEAMALSGVHGPDEEQIALCALAFLENAKTIGMIRASIVRNAVLQAALDVGEKFVAFAADAGISALKKLAEEKLGDVT